MTAPRQPLRLVLHLCVAIFLAMSVAHAMGLKLPLLFVYYDTPYFAYQDRIIAITLFTHALLFLSAARDRANLAYVLVSIWVSVLGLAFINQSAALAAVLETQGTTRYWLQTAVFAGLAIVLTVLALQERRKS